MKKQDGKPAKQSSPEEKPAPANAPVVPSGFTKKQYSVADLFTGIRTGDRVILGQAITLIESTRPDHQLKARELVEACLPFAGNSVRIGITGTPGVGKSTFIETLGQHLLQKEKKLAVLAIDPSSQRSRGSILGDKTRMEKLSASNQVFIRPSPAGGSLGGVARKTRETILLCEAAGFDTIIVETVGVGQSETSVHSMVDFFLLLLLPGAGDELQGIKRGIVEMADLIAVNKADGDRIDLAKRAMVEYRNALHLFPPKESNWTVKALTCSALENTGIAEIWTTIEAYFQMTRENGFFTENRRRQAGYWFYESIDYLLRELFFQHPEIQKQVKSLETQVLAGQLSSFSAAAQLIQVFKESPNT